MLNCSSRMYLNLWSKCSMARSKCCKVGILYVGRRPIPWWFLPSDGREWLSKTGRCVEDRPARPPCSGILWWRDSPPVVCVARPAHSRPCRIWSSAAAPSRYNRTANIIVDDPALQLVVKVTLRHSDVTVVTAADPNVNRSENKQSIARRNGTISFDEIW